MNMQFGLGSAVPKTATAAWGARLIFPVDLLRDRQSFPGMETAAGAKLKHWLNRDGDLRKALAEARKLSKSFKLAPEDRYDVTLYEDAVGCIVANPNASYGYLYCAAWLKEEASQ